MLLLLPVGDDFLIPAAGVCEKSKIAAELFSDAGARG